MRQVVTYIRVSTAQQGRSGLGIEAQREALAHFIEAEGCEALAEFVEVEQARVPTQLIAGRNWPQPWRWRARQRRRCW